MALWRYGVMKVSSIHPGISVIGGFQDEIFDNAMAIWSIREKFEATKNMG